MISKNKWIIKNFSSTLFLFIISPYPIVTLSCIFSIQPTVLQFLLLFHGKFFSFFIIPIFFLILSFFMKKKHYSVFIFSLTTLSLVINFSWIIYSWPFGIEYQGYFFTIIMTIINFFCFFTIYVSILYFKKTRRVFYLYFATLLLLTTLSLFAFPWLGESI